jgi:hypothetical protein
MIVAILRKAHAVDGFVGGSLGHSPVIAINLPVGCQVQIWGVQQPVHAFQWQSFAASFAKKPQDGVGCSHLASFPSFGLGDTYPATLCQGVALAPFQGLLLCLLDGRPFSDSYEGSVALSVATRRPSRLYA